MKAFVLFSTLPLLLAANMANAGTISNGAWSPAGCGEKPALPAVSDKDIDTFNKSVEDINAWQLKAKTYFECLVKEANSDNSAIAQSANKEQTNHRDNVEKIRETIAAAEKKLDKQ